MAVDQRREYVVWSAQGGGPSVRIASSVVERLNVDVMRGFGVTRRRGTESGGVLLGHVDSGTVWIEDYEEVPCEYAYGPSYVLSEADRVAFSQAVAQSARPATRAVGYYRSHTRDGLNLEPPDVELFERFFGSNGVVLLIRPFATRAARASFFVPEGGRLKAGPASDDFPFTTQVMEETPTKASAPVPEPAPAASVPAPQPQVAVDERTPEPIEPAASPVVAPVAAPMVERAPEPAQPPPQDADKILANVLGPKNHALDEPAPFRWDRSAPQFGEYQKPRSRWKRAASWSAFALALFAFGAAAGFRYAGGKPAVAAPAEAPPNPYAVSLRVEPQGANLVVQWNREAAVMRSASSGVLFITDPTGSKEVQLSAAELRNGTIIYQGSAPQVTFRFEVILAENRSFVETATWRAPSTP